MFGLVIGIWAAPEKLIDRVSSIKDYKGDASAMGRINAWHFAWNLALDRPLTGGGFECFNKELFEVYAPDPFDVRAPHSIYFEILGNHGFLGLGLYLLTIVWTFLSLRKVELRALEKIEGRMALSYSRILQMSLFGYLVSGAFLGRAYFDLFYNIVGMAVVLKILTLKCQNQRHR